VLSTPPAFVLSQDQTLQTKTREKPDQKKHATPQHEEHQNAAKKQQTKTTKHTIEFSNNTPAPTAQPARGN
jgi:hypothetical protein